MEHRTLDCDLQEKERERERVARTGGKQTFLFEWKGVRTLTNLLVAFLRSIFLVAMNLPGSGTLKGNKKIL